MKIKTRINTIIISICMLYLAMPTAVLSQYDSNPDFPDYSQDSFYSSYDNDDDDDESSYFQTFNEDMPVQQEEQVPVIVESRPAPLPAGAPIKLEEKSIRFGRIPFRSLREMMTQAVPLLRLLQKKTGAQEVRFVSSGKSYASVLDSLARGNIDFAWVGPTVYLKRRDQDKLMPIAKAKFGSETAYRGVFIAPAKGKVQGLEDLVGSKIGFVDPESASGYIYPMYLLLRLGINPQTKSTIYFMKNHDNVLQAVLDGRLDAGVCLESTLKAQKENVLDSKIIILAKTDEIPSDVIVCRQDCPINLRERFLAALLQINAKDLPGEQVTFLPATDDDFISVEGVLQYLDSLKVKK